MHIHNVNNILYRLDSSRNALVRFSKMINGTAQCPIINIDFIKSIMPTPI